MIAIGLQLKRISPIRPEVRVRRENRDSFTDDGSIHPEIRKDEDDCNPNRFLKALEKDPAKECNQDKRDADLPGFGVVFHEGVEHRVFPDVRSGIRCRQRNRDDKVCRHKS